MHCRVSAITNCYAIRIYVKLLYFFTFTAFLHDKHAEIQEKGMVDVHLSLKSKQ